MSIALRLFSGLYGLTWQMARPFLRRHKRLAHGFAQRLAPQNWLDSSAVDCWVQAASGGEAYLVRQLAQELAKSLPASAPPLRLLCTSCTTQGLEILDAARQWAEAEAPQLTIIPRFFPLDQPSVMRRALTQAAPKLLLLLETELWPGLLLACADNKVPVVLVNGRMREKSLRGYKKLGTLWTRLAPAQVLAVSADDAARFAALFGAERVGVMPNMKFGGVQAETGGVCAPLPIWLPPETPFIVLGSVRKEEEKALLPVLAELLQKAPQACVALAPRHMERIEAWVERLEAANLPFLRRSTLERETTTAPGRILLWDRFGELRALYDRADAVFVGGTLAALGGQNFLEPLSSGIIPCIGPDFRNFAWAGNELFTAGLVRVVPDAASLAQALLEQLAAPVSKASVQARFAAYLAPRRGGSRQAATLVLDLLQQQQFR